MSLEILLDRWLVRPSAPCWNRSGLDAEVGPRSRSVRGGSFEFDHERIRRLVYDDVNLLRRQVLHAQITRALETLPDSEANGLAEELAHHALLANDLETAVRHFEAAATVALARFAPGNALACYQRAVVVLNLLVANTPSAGDRARWRAEAERLTAAAGVGAR